MKLGRYLLSTVLAVLGLLVLAVPVMASVSQPSDLEIQEVTAYQNSRENGDQLYFIKYYIDFAALPDENVDELFIFRLLDADDAEVTSATAYPYYSQGYELGVVAFYLEPEDAPTWGSSVSVQVAGNPLIDWDGDPPSTTTTSITWNTGTAEDMQQMVSSKVVYLASQLEVAWDVEMTTAASGMTVLSDTGSAYFVRVVPYLTEVAPYCQGQQIYTPDYPEDKPGEDAYATTLIDALDGTVFDLSGPARSFNTSPGVIAASLYYPIVVFFLVLLGMKFKLGKSIMFIACFLVVAGAFIGVPLIVTIIAALLAGGSTLWVVYKGAP